MVVFTGFSNLLREVYDVADCGFVACSLHVFDCLVLFMGNCCFDL